MFFSHLMLSFHRANIHPTQFDGRNEQGFSKIQIFTLAIITMPMWLTFQAGAREHLRFQTLSVEHGLSQNVVPAIHQDRFGFMWFGTQDGLNRYDGYHFRIYRHDPTDSTTISDNWIQCITEDTAGYLWVGTAYGLNRYDAATDTFTRFPLPKPDNGTKIHEDIRMIFEDSQNRIWIGTAGNPIVLDPTRKNATVLNMDSDRPNHKTSAITEDRGGNIWFGFQTGGAGYLPPSGEPLLTMIDWDDNNPSALINNVVWFINQDRNGMIWIGTGDGLRRYDPADGHLQRFNHDPANPNSICNDDVRAFLEDSSGELWFGTGSGLNRYRTDIEQFDRFQADSGDSYSLGYNAIISLVEDASGLIWIGTMGNGLNKLDKTQERFEYLRHHPSRKNSLGHSSVFAIQKDHTGIVWIGSHGGGLDRYDPITGRIRNFSHDPENPKSLSNNEIWSIKEDQQHKIWIGTTQGLNIKQKEGFKIYMGEPGIAGKLSGSWVVKIHVDRAGEIWVATFSRGLNRYLPESDSFQLFSHDPEDKNTIPSQEIWAIEDGDGPDLWLGTSNGLALFEYNRQGEPRVTTYRNVPGKVTSLSANRVLSLKRADDGILWVGTANGFSRMNLDNSFTTYREQHGLPNDFVYCILEDKESTLWLSTNRGISNFNPDTNVFHNYDVFDGLQGSEFNLGAGFRDEFGKLYFAGVNGLNSFYPKDLKKCPHQPPIVLTELLIFNKEVLPKRLDPTSPLSQTIEQTDYLELTYNRATISLEFAGLTYSQPNNNLYAYQLEGVDQEWIFTNASRRFVTYGHLAPGTYNFKVKGSNKDGVWNETGKELAIRILPPPWKTLPAYISYATIILLLFLLLLRHQKKILAHERAMNERLLQVDKLRDEFLANTTHELNTPLNGIVGLAESLLNGIAGPLPEKASDNLSMIVTSGRRLTSLVNDILDFSSLKNDSLVLKRKAVSTYDLANVVLSLSQPFVTGKDVTLTNAIPPNTPLVIGDANRLEQVMHNLVGNAVKFTEEGSVTVSAETAEDRLLIKVADTGIGIPADKIDLIFQSFKQADASTARVYGGSGLGLAITRQLVLLQGGEIRVESEPGKGSIFTVAMPLFKGDLNQTQDQVHDNEPDLKPQVHKELAPSDPGGSGPEAFLWSSMTMPLLAKGKVRILVVDDEPVNRRVIADFLQPLMIEEAEDGSMAIDLILEAAETGNPYDLVLLDVMMPRISGYDVCRVVRQRFSLRELPIIFLTAKNQIQNIVRGFKLGANDYLTKPVEREELLSRIRTHLELRALSRDLESKVEDRTRELDLKLKELETHNRIMQTINREVSFSNVGRAMLEQAGALFPKLDRGAFLCFNQVNKDFRVIASRGYETNTIERATATLDQLENQFMVEMDIAKGDILISNPDRGITAIEPEPAPACRVAMIIRYEQKIVGIMVLESKSDVDAFHSSDLPRISRYREHAISAVVKAKMLEDMVLAQKKLVEAAHTSGMAEIAAHVMHTVGNSLNSARISAEMIRERMDNDKYLSLLSKTSALLNENTENLLSFLAEDNRDQKIPSVLTKVTAHLNKRDIEITEESARLLDRMEHLSDVLREQEEFTHVEALEETCNLNSMIHEILEMESYLLKEAGIQTEEFLEQAPEVMLDTPKLKRVLQYIFKNAREALAHMREGGRITLTMISNSESICIKIKDNGPGINPQIQDKIFNRGFTTKPGHRGFGLHYCANAMREMDGSIQVTGLGENRGALIEISLPNRLSKSKK